MGKSPDAFRTISEVADWLQTPAHVLRFWESRFSQIKPVKRAGGRRYYRPTDMQLLGGIKKLLHDDGLTIKGVQKLIREKGVKHVSALSHPVEETEASDTVTAAPLPFESIAEIPIAVNSAAKPTVKPITEFAVEPIATAVPTEPPMAPEADQSPPTTSTPPDLFTDPAEIERPTAAAALSYARVRPGDIAADAADPKVAGPALAARLRGLARTKAGAAANIDNDKLKSIYLRLKILRAQMDAPAAKKSGR